MDNQQETTSWLCGFIDGEGSFSDTKKSGCRVRISNTEIDAIELCEDILKQLGVICMTYDWKRSKKKREYEVIVQSWEHCFQLYNAVKDSGLCRLDELKSIVGSSETIRENSSNLSWMIGVFEAEASFHISCHMSKGGNHNYTPGIAFSNKRLCIIDQVVKTLWSKGLPWHIRHYVPSKKEHSEYDVIDIRGYKRVKRALNLILPGIKTSRIKDKAELLMEFITTRLAQNVQEPYTQRQHEIYSILRNMR